MLSTIEKKCHQIEQNLNQLKESVKKGIDNCKVKVEQCQEFNIGSMTEQLQADYLDRYEGFQTQIHQLSQFGDSSALIEHHICILNRKFKKRCHESSKAIFKQRSVHDSAYFTRWYRLYNSSR